MLCRHFGVCGGCQWQDVPYAEQLGRKKRLLEALLHDALGSAAPEVQPVLGTPSASDLPWRFRQKAAFVFGELPDRRGLAIGHFARGSRDLVPLKECPVHGDRANRLAFALADALRLWRVPAAGARLEGILRHLIVRTSLDEREAVAMLVVTRNDPSLRAPIRAFLAGPERPTGFYLNVHKRPGPFMVGRQTICLTGRSHVRENRLGTSFLISPTAFFQTNVEATATLLREVLDAITSTTASAGRLSVLDLYSGTGLYAIPLAKRGIRVTAIEENRDATRDAVANRRLNGVVDGRLKIITGRVEDVLPRLQGQRFDRVVLDPPRQGCPPRVIDAVFRGLAPPLAVHVSCNPATLAAELSRVVALGYRVARVQPVDMFPHTDHVETVVTIEDRNRASRDRR
jgi:23S rRNA (uracil1939-C5)-methyltransferase